MFGESEKVKAMLEAMMADKSVGLILLGDDLSDPPAPKDKTILKVVRQLRSEGNRFPIVLVPSFDVVRSEELRRELEACGVALLGPGRTGYSAIRHLFDYCNYKPEDHTLRIAAPDRTAARKTKEALSEEDSKKEMQGCGVPVPAQVSVTDKTGLAEAFGVLNGPLALKINSPDISHKTEAGGVKLNISTEAEAAEAFDSIMESCRNYDPAARLSGILVQEMALPGTEMIVGVTNDVQFGPILLVGMGGVTTELFKDVSVSPCPVNEKEALEMVSSLKSFRLLTGFRGSDKRDVDALVQLLVKVSEYAVENKDDLAELDLNPVFVYPEGKGVKAVDALVVKYK